MSGQSTNDTSTTRNTKPPNTMSQIHDWHHAIQVSHIDIRPIGISTFFLSFLTCTFEEVQNTRQFHFHFSKQSMICFDYLFRWDIRGKIER